MIHRIGKQHSNGLSRQLFWRANSNKGFHLILFPPVTHSKAQFVQKRVYQNTISNNPPIVTTVWKVYIFPISVKLADKSIHTQVNYRFLGYDTVQCNRLLPAISRNLPRATSLLPWRWRKKFKPKLQQSPTILHSITTLNRINFFTNSVPSCSCAYLKLCSIQNILIWKTHNMQALRVHIPENNQKIWDANTFETQIKNIHSNYEHLSLPQQILILQIQWKGRTRHNLPI